MTGLGRSTYQCLRSNIYNNSDPGMEADSIILQRQVVTTLGDKTHALTAEEADASEDGTGRGQPIVAYQCHGNNVGPMGTLRKGDGGLTSGVPFIASDDTRGLVVRRLMPIECERLQGFPDDHTLVSYRKKMSCDGPRYKALGNSIAVPVLSWLGKRLALQHVA